MTTSFSLPFYPFLSLSIPFSHAISQIQTVSHIDHEERVVLRATTTAAAVTMRIVCCSDFVLLLIKRIDYFMSGFKYITYKSRNRLLFYSSRSFYSPIISLARSLVCLLWSFRLCLFLLLSLSSLLCSWCCGIKTKMCTIYSVWEAAQSQCHTIHHSRHCSEVPISCAYMLAWPWRSRQNVTLIVMPMLLLLLMLVHPLFFLFIFHLFVLCLAFGIRSSSFWLLLFYMYIFYILFDDGRKQHTTSTYNNLIYSYIVCSGQLSMRFISRKIGSLCMEREWKQISHRMDCV